MKSLLRILQEAVDEGQAGDWRKEGYTIGIEKEDYYGAKDEVVARLNGQVVGRLQINLEYENNGKLANYITVSLIKIDREHRRKGLATAMYQAAEQHWGKKIKASGYRMPDGHALWAQPNRPFGLPDNAKG